MKKAVSWLLLFLLVFAAPAQAAVFMRNCALEQSLYRENHLCSHNGDYGTTTQTSGDHGLYQPMLYTHCELDSETGFYHNRARHYAPKLGKFLARDPIASHNLYSYCHGDPINFSDPSGLDRVYVEFTPVALGGYHANIYLVSDNKQLTLYRGDPEHPVGHPQGFGALTAHAYGGTVSKCASEFRAPASWQEITDRNLSPDDSAKVKAAFDRVVAGVNRDQLGYDILSRNSNSFAATALDAAGLL